MILKLIKLQILFYLIIQFIFGQCNDNEVEIWSQCYPKESTFELILSGQNISGYIPLEIFELTNLMYIDLSDNNLTGPIPSEISSIENLLGLDLSNNSLTGDIPESIGYLPNLMILNLSRNHISGVIPSSIGNMISLTKLSLGENSISGHIPEEIGTLTFLSELSLSRNQLSGDIPVSLYQLVNLEIFLVNDNSITGEIMDEICSFDLNFSNPYEFNIDSNKICQPYPNCIANFTGYQDYSDCDGMVELWGQVYYSKDVTELVMPNMSLSGSIPHEIGSLPIL